jgi:hypothetical protein
MSTIGELGAFLAREAAGARGEVPAPGTLPDGTPGRATT